MKQIIIILILCLVLATPVYAGEPQVISQAPNGTVYDVDGRVACVFKPPDWYSPQTDFGLQVMQLSLLYRAYIDGDEFIGYGQLDTPDREVYILAHTEYGLALLTDLDGQGLYFAYPTFETLTPADLKVVAAFMEAMHAN